MPNPEAEFHILCERLLRSQGVVYFDTFSTEVKVARLDIDEGRLEVIKQSYETRARISFRGNDYDIYRWNYVGQRVDYINLTAVVHMIPILEKHLVIDTMADL